MYFIVIYFYPLLSTLGTFLFQNIIKCRNIFQPHTWRHSGVMVSALASGSSCRGFQPWPGTLCCVLGQDTSYIDLSYLANSPLASCRLPTCTPRVLSPCPTLTETELNSYKNIGKFQSYSWPCSQNFCLFNESTIALPNKWKIL